jgi:protein ImuA
MSQPTALSVMRNRAAVAAELRRLLPRMDGFRGGTPIPFGLPAIDRLLPQGGLAGGALHEVVPEPGAVPAAFGFLAALLIRASAKPAVERSAHAARSPSATGGGIVPAPPVIFVFPGSGLPDYGRPHGHGLAALGLDPSRLILVETRHRKETLWAVEEALRSRAPAAVAGAVDRIDLKTSQRLHLAATDCGLPLFLLRPSEGLESSAAATRWRVGTAPAVRDRFGLVARPRWRLALERCRNGRPGEWMVEYDHVAHRFSLAATLADPAPARGAVENAFRQAG